MKIRHLPLLMLAASALACSAGTDSQDDEQDLTSITARTRTLKFASYVYVHQGATQSEIVDAVKHQTQSAFGALRTATVGVQTRELSAVDPKTFTKLDVKVLDASKPNDPPRTLTKVSYTYTDTALVPKTMATRSSLSMGVLNGDYEVQTSRIMKECTANDKEAQEFESSIWYVFEPGLTQCKTAMTSEQQKIDADKKKLGSTNVPLSEVTRLYIPVTASLASAGTTAGTTYPEYDRLFSGGVASGKLVVGMVSGLMADWAAGDVHANVDDQGYDMWFEGLRAIFTARPGFKMTKIEPQEDLTSFVVSGKTIKMPGGFDDIVKMELDGTFPAAAGDHQALRVAVANKLIKHWVTFDAPVTVKVGSAAAKDFTIELQSYFGAEEDPTPHKRAIKTSDIFVYNGHSYIGYGPLDPSNFSKSDFPASYQVIVVNGCISFNYYDHYFGMKSGGTKNLDTITNGLESWVDGSGPAMGRLVGSLIDGKKNSYSTVLKAAQFDYSAYGWGNDALRVVDGETDNVFKPSKVSLSVTAR
jgi:hypothetical protein